MKVTELLEGRGEEVLRFNDYAALLTEVSPTMGPIYRKIGIALFREGFSRQGTEFYNLHKEGGVTEFGMPAWHNKDAIKRGNIRAHFYDTRDGRLHRFEKILSVDELARWSLPTFLQHMRDTARPV